MYNENKDGEENKNCHYKLYFYKRFHCEANVLATLPVTSPWKPGALWNTEYNYLVFLLLLHPV
jgi:hypothetical protein